MSTDEITPWRPATGATWFDLSRHDGDDDGTAGADDSATDGGTDEDDAAAQMLADAVDDGADGGQDDEDDTDDEGADSALGDAGKKALARMKAERAAAKQAAAAAKKEAAEQRKQLAAMQARLQEFEDRDKSDLEKAQAAADRAKEQAAKAVARSVTAEIKMAAAGRFADPTDAVEVLMRNPDRFVGSDGEIDADAIDGELAELLERKPHWGIPEPVAEPDKPKKPRPQPDPAQGSRGTPPPKNYRDAPPEEVASYLAKYGYRPRR